MTSQIENRLAALASSVVVYATRRPRLVLAGALVLTVLAGWATVSGLALDSDPDHITSPDLPFRRAQARLEEAFPQLVDNLVLVVDAPTGLDARRATEDLADALSRDPAHFASVYAPGIGPYYETFGLYYLDDTALEEAAERLERAGPLLAALERTPTLAAFTAVLARVETHYGGLASLGDPEIALVDRVAAAVESFLAGTPAAVDWEALGSGLVAGGGPTRRLLLVQPGRDFSQFGPALEAIATARARAAEIAPQHSARVRVTGDVAVLTDELDMARGQIVVAMLASLALVTFLLWISIGPRLLASTLVALLVGLVWTAGFAALSVGRLNLLTMAFAVLYVGLGVDFGIHFAVGYREHRVAGDAPHAALRTTGWSVGSSLVLCAVTTAIGFYAFVPTAYAAVGELGVIAGGGMFLSLLATLTLQPALVTLGLGDPRGGRPPWLERSRFSLPGFPLRAPGRTLLGAALAASVAAVVAPAWRFESDPLDVRDPRAESVQTMRELLTDPELAPWTAEVLARDADDARRVKAALAALPEVDRVRSVEEMLPEHPKRKAERLAELARALEAPDTLPTLAGANAPDPRTALHVATQDLAVALDLGAEMAELAGEEPTPPPAAVARLRAALAGLDRRLEDRPESVDVAALDALLFGELPEGVRALRRRLATRPPRMEDLPRDVVTRYVAPDGRRRIEAISAEDLSAPGALDRFADAVLSVRPDAAGAAIGSVSVARTITRALRQAFTVALLVVTALLMGLWRSVRDSILALVPLLLGALATAAIAVAVGMHLNFANVIVLPLILGIGVDSGIHLVHRHRAREPGDIDVLHTGTARAVLLSALTSIGSFATLAFASHRGIASLAQLLVLGLAAVVVANLLVLPALLVWSDARRAARARPAGVAAASAPDEARTPTGP